MTSSLCLSLSSLLSILAPIEEASPAITDAGAPSAVASATGVASPTGSVSGAAPSTSGFAVDLETGGLSGSLGGTLGLGWGSRQVQGGVAFDVAHASLSEQQYGSDNNDELTTTALSVGPWLRFAAGHTLDGRVDLIASLDLQYTHRSSTLHTDTSVNGVSGAADGVVVRVGPGIRFWATPWLALAYTTQISFTYLSGPLAAFSPTSTIGPLNYSFGDSEVALVGRFGVLGLF